MDPRLEWLQQRGTLTAEQIRQAQAHERASTESIGRLCVEMGFISEQDLAEAFASMMGCDVIDLRKTPPSEEALAVVPGDFVRTRRVVPVALAGDQLTVAVSEPEQMSALEQLRFSTGKHIRMAVATASQLADVLARRLPESGRLIHDVLSGVREQAMTLDITDASTVKDLKQLANQTPIVRLVDMIVAGAVSRRASDIHVEPFEDELVFRYRIDGRCDVVSRTPKTLSAAVISRIKVMADLDVAESRVPQDGRMIATVEGREVDLRISTLPTVFGESVVMRVLDRGSMDLSLDQVGMHPVMQAGLRRVIEQPHGMLLVTGPTGSGKTTTLYSCLRLLNRPELKLLTSEDPVEYDIDGVIQVPINQKIGLTFARCLRSFLRQDPDVVMVGEIRDEETAQIAVQSALTGHLVLSTLHTNDAPGAVTRLRDMGIEPYLITSTVSAVLAQRLVRRLCPTCREPYLPSPLEVRDLFGASSAEGGVSCWRSKGCSACRDTGFSGRTGIFEMLLVTEPVRRAILDQAPLSDLRAVACREGMVTLRQDGIDKVRQGLTTIEEVLRATQQ